MSTIFFDDLEEAAIFVAHLVREGVIFTMVPQHGGHLITVGDTKW